MLLHEIYTAYTYFFSRFDSHSGPRPPSFVSFRHHTQTQHTRQDSPRRVISPMQWPRPNSTQHSQVRDIYAHGGIWYRNARRGHWDLPLRNAEALYPLLFSNFNKFLQQVRHCTWFWFECKIEISGVNILIHLHTVLLMNFILLAWIRPYWAETCCQNKVYNIIYNVS